MESSLDSTQQDHLREAARHYHQHGYAVINGVLSSDQCAALKQRMRDLVEGFDEEEHRSIFKTGGDNQSVFNTYFTESADKIRFFFEDGAFDKNTGALLGDKSEVINKAGHALHELDSGFKQVTDMAVVGSILALLGYVEPAAVQSMYIFKQPGIGGEVKPHQDSTFLYTSPLSTVGLWFAIDDATPANGCLWAVPGSHQRPVQSRLVRKEDGGVEMQPPAPVDLDISNAVCLPVPKGSLVLIHGSLVHYSKPNASETSRHAYSLHVIECKDTEYSSSNWLQRQSFYKIKLP